MPLFQPSNITPSSFAGVGGGTVAVADKVKTTWQVNGNTPMTAYKIDIFDMDNNPVYSSGILTDNTPFYPTDNKGNPKYFSYAPSVTWESLGLLDGDEYTFQITQWWGTDKTEESSTKVVQFSQSSFITRTMPELTIKTASGSTDFSTIGSVFQDFIADYTQAQNDSIDWARWKLFQNNVLIDDTGIVNTQVLSYTADNMRSGQNYKIVCTIQTENGVQVTTESEFSVSYEIPKAEGQFEFNCIDKASNLLRWSEIQENTGDDIQGVSNDNNYSFQNGNLVLPQGSTVTWNTKNDGELDIPTNWTLAWKGQSKINARTNYRIKGVAGSKVVATATISSNGDYVVVGFSTKTSSLFEIYQVTKNGPSRCYEFKIPTVEGWEEFSTGRVKKIVFSPKGDWFVVAWAHNVALSQKEQFASVFSFSNGTATYQQEITKNGEPLSNVATVAFSPNGELLVVGGDSLSYSNNIVAYIYNVQGETISYSQDIIYSRTTLCGAVDVVFTPDSKTMFFCLASASPVLYQIETSTLSELPSPETVGYSNSVIIFESGETVAFLSTSPTGSGYGYITFYTFINNSANLVERLDCSVVEEVRLLRLQKSTDGTKLLMTCDGDDPFVQLYALEVEQTRFFSVGIYNFSVNEKAELVVDIDNTSSFLLDGISHVWINAPLENFSTLQLFVSINKNHVSLSCNNQTKEFSLSDDYVQSSIKSVELSGEQICQYVYIENGTTGLNQSFLPDWATSTIFLTAFQYSTLQAGQLEVAENSMDIYRENVSTGEFEKLYSCGEEATQLRDFSWITGNKYNYYGYARLDNAYTNANAFTESPVCRNQSYYLLLATTQDEEQPNVYHVVHYWKFGNNIGAGSVGNNNSPNFLNNFTGYRLKQPTARKGKSGTLTALLSNAVNGEYKDTTLQMENLYALSECNNPLFLKDMKGNLYMVTVSAPITQTINTKSAYQEVKVSIPWEEIGSADGISLIQLPTDEGWVDDNAQLVEVRLEVDEETGMLRVIYPYDYNYATTFGLVRPDLYATTADGVEQADLELVDGAVILNNNNEG